MVVRRHLILCLPWLAFGLLLTNAAAQAQAVKVECDQLGSSLDAFLTSEAVDGQKQPIVLPEQLHNSSLDSLRQYDSAHNLKNLEPILTGDEIVSCFGNQGRELYFLRNSVENQRNRLRVEEEQNKLFLKLGQITTIALGALATILLGLGSDKWKKLAIIPTALVTALASFVAFEDYRGEITRTAKAESDLSKLDTEIEIALLEAATRGARPPFSIVGKQVEAWWVRADGIIKGVDDDWLSRFSKEQKVEVKGSQHR
jgi:hypothetical protein